MPLPQIWLIDRNVWFRNSLKHICQSAGYHIAGEAGSLRETLVMLQAETPLMLLLEWSADSAQRLPRFRQTYPHSLLIVLLNVADGAPGILPGTVNGWLYKETLSPPKLLSALEAAMAGL